MICGPLMQIAATNAHIGDFEQNILVTDRRAFDFTDLDGTFFR